MTLNGQIRYILISLDSSEMIIAILLSVFGLIGNVARQVHSTINIKRLPAFMKSFVSISEICQVNVSESAGNI